jgi:excisionase family DNA binding protein
MTTTEVIDLLRTTRHTLCAWARTGKIPAVRTPGNGYLFDPVALATWMEERSR